VDGIGSQWPSGGHGGKHLLSLLRFEALLLYLPQAFLFVRLLKAVIWIAQTAPNLASSLHDLIRVMIVSASQTFPQMAKIDSSSRIAEGSAGQAPGGKVDSVDSQHFVDKFPSKIANKIPRLRVVNLFPCDQFIGFVSELLFRP
jgi:hypothetical protein